MKPIAPFLSLFMLFCTAILFDSCKNDTNKFVSNSIPNEQIIERIKAEALAEADSIVKAKASAKALTKTVSLKNEIAEEEVLKIDKPSKSTTKPSSKTNAKPTNKTQSTINLPNKTAKSATPMAEKKNDNIKKRVGKDDVWMIVEAKPTYPGGVGAMMKFLRNNMQYPTKAKEEGIKGTVFVRFVVEKDGLVTDIDVSKSVHPLLDSEAKRVVRSMPTWTAGLQNGQPVATQYTLPVRFELIE